MNPCSFRNLNCSTTPRNWVDISASFEAALCDSLALEEVLCAIRHAAVAASCFTASGLAMAVARRRAMQDRLALSPRETEVLRLLNDGLSVPAIASQMFISLSTAKTYVARLYEKLGAANRAQALMAALHHGLIQYHEYASSEEKATGRAGADRRHDVVRPLSLVGLNPQGDGDASGEPGNRAPELGQLVSSARRSR